MSTGTLSSVGTLLHDYRRAAGLTQEALALRAGVSTRSIQALERGRSKPQKHTLQRLVAALGLPKEEQARLVAVATATPRNRAPAEASRSAPALRLPLTPLLGRGREVATLSDLLRRDDIRLITLTGMAGIGKTRLALEAAVALHAHFRDGVWLVELASLHDPALLPQALAAALGVAEQPGTPLLTTLTDSLRSRHALLLLDNCEHLIEECARLCAALLPACPRLHLLATSREALSIAGERTFAVPPLAVPPPDAALPPPADLPCYAAVQLFVQRASALSPRFALTQQNAAAVAALVQRLEGLPLAIELAAARIPVLTVAQIVARLDDRFHLLTGGRRDVPARHQTLRAALDWSYDLLTAGEQALLRRLSVCVGGCTLAAAEAVGAGDGVASAEVLNLLGSLVAKSLLQVEEVAGEARYGLLETVRQYAAERLATAGAAEEAAVRERHLRWCVALAEEAAPQLRGPQAGEWLDALEREYANLRAALRWALGADQEPRPQDRHVEGPWPQADLPATQGALGRADQPQPMGRPAPGQRLQPCFERGQGTAAEPAESRSNDGLRLAAALWRFWYSRGYVSEGRAWLETALHHAAGADSALRALALTGAGNLAFLGRDYPQAQALLEGGLALRRTLGDTRLTAYSLANLGLVAQSQGDYTRAQELLEESLALQRETGDANSIASALTNLGLVAQNRGDLTRARALLEESLALTRQLGDTAVMAYALLNLGEVAFDQGDYAQAQAWYEESLNLQRAVGTRWMVAGTLINLGAVAHARGDDARAQALLREGLGLEQSIVATHATAEGLEVLAAIAPAQDQAPWAARLLGAAAAVRAALGAPLLPTRRAAYERTEATVRAALGAEQYAAGWTEGRAMTPEQAIALAISGAPAART